MKIKIQKKEKAKPTSPGEWITLSEWAGAQKKKVKPVTARMYASRGLLVLDTPSGIISGAHKVGRDWLAHRLARRLEEMKAGRPKINYSVEEKNGTAFLVPKK